MKSKTSLFSKGVFIHNIKTYWWISLIHFIILFFILPINHLNLLGKLNFDKKEEYKSITRQSLQFQFNDSKDFVQLLLIFVIPVIVGTILFSYKNKKKSTTFYHTLPISKKSLFITNVTTGFLIFTVPIIVNSVVLIILNIFTPLGQLYKLTDIFIWTALMIVSYCTMYALTIFIGMFTGNTVASIVLTYIVYFIPYFLDFTLERLLPRFIYGFDNNGFDKIIRYNPVYQFTDIMESKITLGLFIMMGLFTIIVISGSYYLYKKIPLESAGNLISFRFIKPLFKYCVTLCCVLLGSALFMGLYSENTIILIIGTILFSAIGYFMTQALIDRSVKVGYAYKGYTGFLASMGIIILLIAMDPFNYVSRVPALNEVEEVYVYAGELVSGTEEETIGNVINFHKDMIGRKDENKEKKYGQGCHINYELKNGKHIIRTYDNVDVNNKYLQAAVDSYEHKLQKYYILTKEVKDIKTIEIYDERQRRKSYIISDETQLKKIAGILKEDILNTSIPVTNIDNFFELRIEYQTTSEQEDRGQNRYIESVYIDDMTNVMNYIKENNIYDKILVSVEDIESVVIKTTTYENGRQYNDNTYNVEDRALAQKIIDEGKPSDVYYNDDEIYLQVVIRFGTSYNNESAWLAIRKDSPILKEIKEQNK